MKQLILVLGLFAGSAYSMGPESQMFASTNNMDDDSVVPPTTFSSLTGYQKKKLELKKLELALEIKQMNSSLFHALCPTCGTFSDTRCNPDLRPIDTRMICYKGTCTHGTIFNEHAYFNKLQREANATILRLQPLLNESE